METPSFIEGSAAAPSETQIQITSHGAVAPATTEIKVSEMTPPAAVPAAAALPPKKGTAKESIFADLRKMAGAEETTKPAAAAVPANPNVAAEAAAEASKVADDKAKGKQSPWKVVEEYKSKTKALEDKLLHYEKAGVPPEKLKPFEDKIADLEKKYGEAMAEMRFHDYKKTPEFQEKYQKPYEQAWTRALSELSEITVPADDGTERQIVATDILELVNLPLREAKALADERFGDFSQDVMQHRKEIKRLFDEQAVAIENVKKEGSERTKQMQEGHRKMFTEVSESVKKTWSEANEAALADEKYGSYFKSVDGDQEFNQRLSKGFELSDRAFSENPMNPNLKPDERAAIVRRHAAVRNRAAAFGGLVYRNTQLEKRLEAANKKLKEYAGAEPELAGGAKGGGQPQGRVSAKDSIFSELRKRAK